MAQADFTEQEKQQIKEAVAKAEGQTSGEIVPYFLERSDNYDEAIWRGGALFSGLALLSAYFFYSLNLDYWPAFDFSQVLLAILLAGGLGVLLPMYIAPLRRALAGSVLIQRRVSARALEAFLEEEVFQTRDRTGILLFVSMFEHRVQVLGDSGINARVQQSDWEHVVRLIVDGIKQKRPADGLIAAIEACGELLRRKGVERREDDTNELSDNLRLG